MLVPTDLPFSETSTPTFSVPGTIEFLAGIDDRQGNEIVDLGLTSGRAEFRNFPSFLTFATQRTSGIEFSPPTETELGNGFSQWEIEFLVDREFTLTLDVTDQQDAVFDLDVASETRVATYDEVMRDEDGDGMRDAWERLVGLDEADPSDASSDDDGDGLTALEEFNMGWSPNSADTDQDGIGDRDDPFDGHRDIPELPESLASRLLVAELAGMDSFQISVASLTDGVDVGFEGLVALRLAGDFNNDGAVNGPDFLTWQRGESADPLSAFDLDVWQLNYGGPAPPLTAATTKVPEPNTMFITAIGAILLVSQIPLSDRCRWKKRMQARGSAFASAKPRRDRQCGRVLGGADL